MRGEHQCKLLQGEKLPVQRWHHSDLFHQLKMVIIQTKSAICFQENPFVSLKYFASSQGDTILPYAFVGSFNRSLPLRPSSSLVRITVEWSQDGSFQEASLSSSVLIMAQVSRHSLPTPLSHPGMMPSCQIFTFCISFKYTYLLVAFPYLPTPTHRSIF